MKRTDLFLLVSLVVFFDILHPIGVSAQSDVECDAAFGEYFVEFVDLEHLKDRLGIIGAEKIALFPHTLPGTVLVRAVAADGELNEAGLSQLKASGKLLSVQKNCHVSSPPPMPAPSALHSYSPTPLAQTSAPDDPWFFLQWGLHNDGSLDGVPGFDIGMIEAWRIEKGDPSLLIGVIDGGIDAWHTDIRNRMWRNPFDAYENGIDDDKNGYIDDHFGFNFNLRNSLFYDTNNSHGTFVAGIIAAETNNGYGISGINQRSKLITMQIFDDLYNVASGSIDRLFAAFEYAAVLSDFGHNIRVLNVSAGRIGNCTTLESVALAALGARGILVVVAAGNDGFNTDIVPYAPSGCPNSNVISVGSMAPDGLRSSFSNFGFSSVDITAPGSFIMSTRSGCTHSCASSFDGICDDGGTGSVKSVCELGSDCYDCGWRVDADDYQVASGTSFAAPMVTGVASLILSKQPELTPEEVRLLLMRTALPVPGLVGIVGAEGMVSASRALSANLLDADGDGVDRDSDCDIHDGSKWRRIAYRDADNDGVADSKDPVNVECYGSTPPPGFVASATKGDSPCGIGDACDSSSERNLICDQSSGDCIYQPLKPSACVGANGFLGQINIASVINLQSDRALGVHVEYFNQAGAPLGARAASIGPKLKNDFIINDFGLQPDSIGLVCVTTDAAGDGAWSGGVTIYKPDLRNGPVPFGEGFDFALYYPFTNPHTESLTVPINTFRLGTLPTALIANWFSVADATPGDGFGLQGTIYYYSEAGEIVGTEGVELPDGGRLDYAAHARFGADRVGMAKFVPRKIAAGATTDFYGTLTRYFYDCPGASCTNFLTAFVLPNRPPSGAFLAGGTATKNGEISIVELGNVSETTSTATVRVFNEYGASMGSEEVSVAPLGTKHIIINHVGTTGYLNNGVVGTAETVVQSGLISAVSLFYKLNEFGVLQYGYAAPFVASPGAVQLSEFNSFISHSNEVEIYNSSPLSQNARLQVINLDQSNLHTALLSFPGKGTKRFKLTIPSSTYGTVSLTGEQEGLILRNYVSRPGTYVLPYRGQ